MGFIIQIHTKKGSQSFGLTPSLLKRRLPTLPLLRSTIGVTRLNFSVRNGKRWIPRAITTLISLKKVLTLDIVERLTRLTRKALTAFDISTLHTSESLGLLVPLGFAIAGLTPAAYQGRRLRPPSGRSNLGAGFVLRCFQHLSDPYLDTRRCAWRHNRQTRGTSNTVLSY